MVHKAFEFKSSYMNVTYCGLTHLYHAGNQIRKDILKYSRHPTLNRIRNIIIYIYIHFKTIRAIFFNNFMHPLANATTPPPTKVE